MVFRNRQRAAGLVLAGALAWSVTGIMTAAPASAATGGGCSNWHSGNSWSSAKACISAPARALVRPDAYVRLSANHPACTINVVAFREGGSVVAGTSRDHACPSGASDRRYPAWDFSASSGTYYTLVTIKNHYSVHNNANKITMP